MQHWAGGHWKHTTHHKGTAHIKLISLIPDPALLYEEEGLVLFKQYFC
jgi:hypothetical protein